MQSPDYAESCPSGPLQNPVFIGIDIIVFNPHCANDPEKFPQFTWLLGTRFKASNSISEPGPQVPDSSVLHSQGRADVTL
jgi:hypothetical protein